MSSLESKEDERTKVAYTRDTSSYSRKKEPNSHIFKWNNRDYPYPKDDPYRDYPDELAKKRFSKVIVYFVWALSLSNNDLTHEKFLTLKTQYLRTYKEFKETDAYTEYKEFKKTDAYKELLGECEKQPPNRDATLTQNINNIKENLDLFNYDIIINEKEEAFGCHSSYIYKNEGIYDLSIYPGDGTYGCSLPRWVEVRKEDCGYSYSADFLITDNYIPFRTSDWDIDDSYVTNIPESISAVNEIVVTTRYIRRADNAIAYINTYSVKVSSFENEGSLKIPLIKAAKIVNQKLKENFQEHPFIYLEFDYDVPGPCIFRHTFDNKHLQLTNGLSDEVKVKIPDLRKLYEKFLFFRQKLLKSRPPSQIPVPRRMLTRSPTKPVGMGPLSPVYHDQVFQDIRTEQPRSYYDEKLNYYTEQFYEYRDVLSQKQLYIFKPYWEKMFGFTDDAVGIQTQTNQLYGGRHLHELPPLFIEKGVQGYLGKFKKSNKKLNLKKSVKKTSKDKKSLSVKKQSKDKKKYVKKAFK
jgi:hypothetical protein